VARLGGDEFLVLLTDHSEAAAEKAMARLQQALDATNEAEARGYDISFSHGLVEFDPKRHPTIGALISEGDSLMYKTKHARR
jgi:diguanylate cyclase (GGDEF)-like protein